jgi:transcription-repair coupling factor (superfamily II helicase)
LQDLFPYLANNKAVERFLKQSGSLVVDDSIGAALLIAVSFQKRPKDYIIVAPNLYSAQSIYDYISSFIGEDNCLFFPADEMLRSESLAASKEMLSQRLYVLEKLLDDSKPRIVVSNLSAFLRYLPDPQLFKNHILTVKKGMILSLEDIKKTLIEAGYLRVNKIDQSLQFAIRGDILDIYSVNAPAPIRIEFFGDEVESIRYFDIATQTSYEEIDEAIMIPGSDLLLSLDERSHIEAKISCQMNADKSHFTPQTMMEFKESIKEDIDRLQHFDYRASLYKYMAFLQDKYFSLPDYRSQATIVLSNRDQNQDSEILLATEALNFLDELHKEGRTISHLGLYQSMASVTAKGNGMISLHEHHEKENEIIFNVRPLLGQYGNLKLALGLVESYIRNDFRVVLTLASANQVNLLKSALEEKKISYSLGTDLMLPEKGVGLNLYNLEAGFEIVDERIVFISSKEIFGVQKHSSRFMTRYKEATILRSYEDLNPGDYVVHEYNGIGKFLEIKTLEVDGVHQDFLHIAYAGTDALYVPLSQFRLVRKFSGREGVAPKLNHLNSSEWEKTKKRIRERVNDIADKLIALYSSRYQAQGIAFPTDDEMNVAFEREFPFELTPDQKKSYQEIKNDMESNKPMDRLLCGDVGFGKTEIAFRAAFKAINAGYQVAFLCPTTLLARQHYENALLRYQSFGIRIAIFSRLIPESIQKDYIKQIERGEIDLVIGTHRLLSKDIRFQKLGLLIVDEEQRFGVEQKERIKEMKNNIDILTLSATPIPRTLQMSLVGIRSLSEINTPPENRMPIQTYVLEYKENVVKELIERELARQGQVFYLHNQVATIFNVANRLQRMIPKAVIGVVHGKMDKDAIEDTMMRFYNGEINLLVCTSIVENGIDVPNANMIIVENAENFGLAQLYQIKGRVGRGNRIAYAYLLYNSKRKMNDTARKRLKAIEDFTELGSGYKIAQRDLMIRGAGDLLGPEQAGFIDTVGIDMYIKLLNQAIEEKKTGRVVEEAPIKPAPALSIDAYIPANYANASDKIELYQDIENAKNRDDLTKISLEIRDIYGRLPEEVEKLLRKRALDIDLQGEEFSEIIDGSSQVTIKLSDKYNQINGIGTALFQALIPLSRVLRFRYASRELRIQLLKEGDWFTNYEKLIEIVKNVYIEYQAKETE